MFNSVYIGKSYMGFLLNNYMNDKKILLIVLVTLMILVLPLSSALSTTTTLAKNGQDFTYSSGNYATKTHCSGQTCSWIADNQAIVGVYDSNPANWQGSLEYDFDLSQFKKINSVSLVVEWPHYTGKGLHSPYKTGSGSIAVKTVSNVIKNYPLNAARCYPANDYFANKCQTWSFTNAVPLSLVENITKVYLKTNAKTAWDIGKVSLLVNADIKCSNNLQCGTSAYSGNPFCSGNNIAKNFITYTCNSPGTVSSYCSSLTAPKTIQTCADYCLNSACKIFTCHNDNECNDNNPSTQDKCVDPNTIQSNCTHTIPQTQIVTIVNGKIQINGREFLVKGMDYAPWVAGTGPDPTQQRPFPGEYEDITAKLTNGNTGERYGKDYSGDGKIQTWEMIRYDIETMKSAGVNTIRTYATGSWHDKNLNGVIDTSTNPNVNEIVQGDLPDWAVDRILQYANDNGMKVIMGYWIQEEDFKTGLITNTDDLKVAKQAFGRVVTKYKSNPAVLGWGIGNEVQGGWNMGWFSWGMDINSYLNQLNDYVRTLDNHPIIYAKYNGENANFANLNVDIIAINAFTNPAPLVPSQCGTIPSGKACMYGEFGHNIDQASGQWNEAKQYAGGAFLEYNNVWWKGGDNTFGIVTAQRNTVPGRFDVVKALYA